MISLPPLSYHRPRTVEEAVSILERYQGEARVLAGGTDLLVDLRARARTPSHLVDIKGIPKLRRIVYLDNAVEVGSAVTLAEILKDEGMRPYQPLYKAVGMIADRIIRFRATLAGNICNASPAADSAPALMVMGAEVNVVGPRGRRTVNILGFFKGVKKTALEPSELVESIRIPRPPDEARSGFVKFGRSSEDLAIVNAAAMLVEGRLRVSYGSVAPTPVMVQVEAENYREAVLKVLREASRVVKPISDVRASAEYRLHLVKVATARLLGEIYGEEI